jgi:PITH domain
MEHTECTGHSHDHEHGDELGLSLRPQMDLPRVFCLNEEVENSGRNILKIHEERLSINPSLQSPDEDPELLLHIPFTESVTIQSISIRSMTRRDTAPPKTIKLFTNRDDLDFETARELPPQMSLELIPPEHFVEGTIDYPVRPAGRFQNISSLTIYFTDNYDETNQLPTEITFVGIKGKGTKMRRQAVETVYESQGMLSDNKAPGDEYEMSYGLM